MAGTSWDRAGHAEAAFEVVASPVRAVATLKGAVLIEFLRDDPVWRLVAPAEAGAIDISWSEEAPDQFDITLIRWRPKPVREAWGSFSRERPAAELAALLESGLDSLNSPEKSEAE